MDNEATSGVSEGVHIFAEDIGEFCTINDDEQFIEQISDSGQFSEVVIIDDEDLNSFEEGASEFDPLLLNPINTSAVSYAQVVLKSEDNVCETETSDEDGIPVPVDRVKIPHEVLPISEKVAQRRPHCNYEQRVALEKTFKKTRYPDYVTKNDLARRLGLTYSYVFNWFKHQREKTSRQTRRCSKKANLGALKKVESSVQSSQGTDMEKDLANVLKSRHIFSESQLVILEGAFKRNHYPDPVVLEDLTVRLGLTNLRTVKCWFSNRRAKTRTANKRPKILKDSCCSRPKLSPARPGAEVTRDISPQREGRRFPPRVGEQLLLPEFRRANQKSIVSRSRVLHCKICDRWRNRVRRSCCEACHSFMKRYRRLSQTRRRLSVPRCSHKGTQVLAGCRGCRLFRYQQEALKQKGTSQLKVTQNRPSVKTNSLSIRKNAPVAQNINKTRRSERLLAISKHYHNSCDDKKTNQNGASGAGISELEAAPTSREYPLDLQKKILVTGKLNKLRKIAITLRNPNHMETKDRIILSGEINACVDDLLSLVFDLVSTTTRKNTSSTGKSGPAKPPLPRSDSETFGPSLEMKIQTLEGMVEESITRIRGLEGQVRNSSRSETSTQTEAYLVFGNQSSELDKPPSLPDELLYHRNYAESTPIVQPSATIRNSPSTLTTYCQICDQSRPYATVNHLSICRFCIIFVENRKKLCRPNHNLLVPRCTHGGTRARFGCEDCLLFRFNRVSAGLMPNITSFGLKSSQPVGPEVKTNGSPAPSPINPARMNLETHQSTGTINRHFTPNLTSSYPPSMQPSPVTSQAGNNHSAVSTLTQLLTLPQHGTTPMVNPYLPSPVTSQAGNNHSAVSTLTQLLTLPQHGTTPMFSPYQRVTNEEVRVTPLMKKNKKCPSLYGLNYKYLWCEGCQQRKGCTRYN